MLYDQFPRWASLATTLAAAEQADQPESLVMAERERILGKVEDYFAANLAVDKLNERE
ncbi:MAG TPA: hypothetical protein VH234_04630 [Candidatus Saccharimonadales bacterium]|jgi:hypothetical protein|nr:hypothetical protein [Candidatus Saccharimonadales bacterium]